jgi:hypothetical protein
MSSIDTQPSNKNSLSAFGFKFSIKKTPNVNWFIQSATIPSISLAKTQVTTPFVTFPVGGDHLIFDDLQITFRVDEDLANYKEIYNWMIGIGFPDNFDQFKNLAQKVPGKYNTGNSGFVEGTNIYSDASLIILSSSMNPIFEINFVDLFPISLSELKFDSQLSSVQYLEATTSFTYRSFTINNF